MPTSVTLRQQPDDYSVSRLDPAAPIPNWADGAGFVSISRSDDELSIVCRTERVPSGIRKDSGWACYRFIGPFAFDETGIVSSVIGPLSNAGIGIFVVSTFDGDHLLIKQGDRERAQEILTASGHVTA